MFYLKMLVLIGLTVATLVQLMSLGMHCLQMFTDSETFTSTSQVSAKVVEVIPAVPKRSQGGVLSVSAPGDRDKVIVEYTHPTTSETKREDIQKFYSAGTIEHAKKNVGDVTTIEVVNPKGAPSTLERAMWKNLSGLLSIFAALLLIGAGILRFF